MVTRESTNEIEEQCAELMRRIDEQVDRHQFRVLESFLKHGVTEVHLQSSTGYGYDDLGRETLEAIYWIYLVPKWRWFVRRLFPGHMRLHVALWCAETRR